MNTYLCLLSLALLCPVLALPDAQVDQEIYDPEDLLAVESSFHENEVFVVAVPPPKLPKQPRLTPIQPAPAGFGGQRLTAVRPARPARPARPLPVAPLPISQSVTPTRKGQAEEALEHSSVINPDGSYSFRYVNPDGTTREESGRPLPASSGGHVQTGGWSYVGPDGNTYSVKFEADANGFRAVGDHLPTPPPLPAALQRFADARAGTLKSKPSHFGAAGSGAAPAAGRHAGGRAGGHAPVRPRPAHAARKPKRIQFKTLLPDQGGRIQFRKNN